MDKVLANYYYFKAIDPASLTYGFDDSLRTRNWSSFFLVASCVPPLKRKEAFEMPNYLPPPGGIGDVILFKKKEVQGAWGGPRKRGGHSTSRAVALSRNLINQRNSKQINNPIKLRS
jgi:hypothetical protein